MTRRHPPTFYVHPERSSAGCDGWSSQFARALRQSGATHIALAGAAWVDLSELVPFADQIESLNIDCPVADMSHLSMLPRLRELYLGPNAQLENVEFARLRHVETLRLAHERLCVEALASASRVRTFYVQNCGLRDLTALQNLSALEHLNVTEAPLKSLKGIDALRSLRKLVLSQVPVGDLEGIERAGTLEDLTLYATRRLSSIAPLSKVTTLRKLSIDSARNVRDLPLLSDLSGLEELRLESVVLTSVDFLADLKGLRVLRLEAVGKIPSLRFLRPLKQLERLVLGQKVTVEDGDLSILMELPALKVAAFFDRRHYSHRRKDIDVALTGRRS